MTGSDAEIEKPVPTERFQRVLVFASDEADGLGHGFITCQHLLYALSRESRGLAKAVLDQAGVTAEKLHDLLADSGAVHDRVDGGYIDLSDEVGQAIGRAVETAIMWNHRVLDTEHLLHSILMTHTSADEALSALNADPQKILKSLKQLREAAPANEIRDEAVHAYRLTIESGWVLSSAMDFARRKDQGVVTEQNLLAGLLTIESPAKDTILSLLAAESDSLMRLLTATPTFSPAKSQRLPLSEPVQRILGYAIGEAWNRGHQSVSPIHIALGLARAKSNLALDLLADFGVSRYRLIDQLEAVVNPPVI